MTTEQTERVNKATSIRAGRVGSVVAVCMRKEKGVPKYPQTEVTIGEYGVEGDYHSGPMRTRSNGDLEQNRRHVTLVAKEVFDELNRELSTDIRAGGFCEDNLLEGLGGLSGIQK